ncbi:MAG: hypothetical protein H6907_07105 [Hyphomicrobiales bacterium]|nr:hypothetical protein [Hyphomicrobiales bacterium]
MQTTLVQSYRTSRVAPWVATCLDSVRAWAADRGWDYRFVDDAIFDLLPAAYRANARGCIPIMTDLGRLLLARRYLARGAQRVIWMDADVLVFDPAGLDIRVGWEFAFGREVWVQRDPGGRLRAYRNVHNAVAVFCAGNSFLDFYIHACQAVVGRLETGGPPQIVGTKLLTALHNMIGFTLVDDVAMFSPAVLRDLAAGGGEALDRLRRESPAPPRAANLCGSLAGTAGGLDDAGLAAVCDRLLANGRALFSAGCP